MDEKISNKLIELIESDLRKLGADLWSEVFVHRDMSNHERILIQIDVSEHTSFNSNKSFDLIYKYFSNFNKNHDEIFDYDWFFVYFIHEKISVEAINYWDVMNCVWKSNLDIIPYTFIRDIENIMNGALEKNIIETISMIDDLTILIELKDKEYATSKSMRNKIVDIIKHIRTNKIIEKHFTDDILPEFLFVSFKDQGETIVLD